MNVTPILILLIDDVSDDAYTWPCGACLAPESIYSVQVQVIDAKGRDMFINDGYGEVVLNAIKCDGCNIEQLLLHPDSEDVNPY